MAEAFSTKQPWRTRLLAGARFRGVVTRQRIVAALGCCGSALTLAYSLAKPSAAAAAVALVLLGLSLLAGNAWDSQHRLPLLGAKGKLQTAGSWIAVLAGCLVLLALAGVLDASRQSGSTAAEASRQALSEPSATSTPFVPPVLLRVASPQPRPTPATTAVVAGTTAAPAGATPPASPGPTPLPSPVPRIRPGTLSKNICPKDQPVKVTAEKLAYRSDHPDYAGAEPRVCYISLAAALEDGFVSAP